MKTTKEMIEVMQAFADGKVVECKKLRSYDTWAVIPSPSWNWPECDYRIKQEPREWFIGLDELGIFRDCRIPGQSLGYGDLKYVLVREVIE